MTSITLDTPVVIVPAQEAKTSSSFKVIFIEENYGWTNSDPDTPIRAPGRPTTVVATIVLSEEPYLERRLTVWEGDDYLAVRGTWTDQDLYAKIKQILEAGQ
jgi:hypothetical protein